jgi:hypothetical protein
VEVDEHELFLKSEEGDGELIFARTTEAAVALRKNHLLASVCCIEDKSYNKRYTDLEKRVLKYLSGNKARFYAV